MRNKDFNFSISFDFCVPFVLQKLFDIFSVPSFCYLKADAMHNHYNVAEIFHFFFPFSFSSPFVFKNLFYKLSSFSSLSVRHLRVCIEVFIIIIIFMCRSIYRLYFDGMVDNILAMVRFFEFVQCVTGKFTEIICSSHRILTENGALKEKKSAGIFAHIHKIVCSQLTRTCISHLKQT